MCQQAHPKKILKKFSGFLDTVKHRNDTKLKAAISNHQLNYDE